MKKLWCCLMILCMLLPLAACNVSDGETTKTPDDDQPAIDMGGYEYRAFLKNEPSSGSENRYEGFEPWGRTDVLSMSTYTRNQAIEEAYNCKITYQYASSFEPDSEFKSLQESGTRFEVVVLNPSDLVRCATMGLLRDLKATEGLDLSGKGFDQNAVDQLSLGEQLYFVSGDMNFSAIDLTAAMVFNQTLWNEKKTEVATTLGGAKYADLYGLVNSGEWTVENMLKIAAAISEDQDPLDGLPLSVENGDTIGYFRYLAGPIPYFYASGGRLSAQDADGYPVLTFGNESRQIYDALYQSMNLNFNPAFPSGTAVGRIPALNSGNTLFTEYLLWDLRRVVSYWDVDFAYGLLPIPTVNAGAEYGSAIMSTGFTCYWSIPVECTNAQYAAEILEAMARYSQKIVTPAYDRAVVCSSLSAKDPSYRTLAQIRSSMVYDYANIYYMYSEELPAVINAIYRLFNATENEYDTYVTEDSVKEAQEFLDTTFAPLRPAE
ncbi:MAG: hypothetical protein IJW29_01170 [Clostridia bacterium]|nr:hypothetical protein [Clostridia bacterium]